MHFLHGLVKFDLSQDLPHLLVTLLAERIKVLSDCALDQERLLGDEGDALPQEVQANVADVDTID